MKQVFDKKDRVPLNAPFPSFIDCPSCPVSSSTPSSAQAAGATLGEKDAKLLQAIVARLTPRSLLLHRIHVTSLRQAPLSHRSRSPRCRPLQQRAHQSDFIDNLDLKKFGLTGELPKLGLIGELPTSFSSLTALKDFTQMRGGGAECEGTSGQQGGAQATGQRSGTHRRRERERGREGHARGNVSHERSSISGSRGSRNREWLPRMTGLGLLQ
jgi:hypothetical protein